MPCKLIKLCDCPPECSPPVIERIDEDGVTVKCSNCGDYYFYVSE